MKNIGIGHRQVKAHFYLQIQKAINSLLHYINVITSKLLQEFKLKDFDCKSLRTSNFANELKFYENHKIIWFGLDTEFYISLLFLASCSEFTGQLTRISIEA